MDRITNTKMSSGWFNKPDISNVDKDVLDFYQTCISAIYRLWSSDLRCQYAILIENIKLEKPIAKARIHKYYTRINESIRVQNELADVNEELRRIKRHGGASTQKIIIPLLEEKINQLESQTFSMQDKLSKRIERKELAVAFFPSKYRSKCRW